MRYLIVIGLCISLSGCIGTKAVTTIVQEGDKTITTITGAAVQRDIVYADERKHRDTQTTKMQKTEGVNTEWGEYRVEKGDVLVVVIAPVNQTVKAPHKYQQDIETRPPDHRGWDTADKVVGVLEKGIFGYFLNEVFQTNSNATGTRYGGDYTWNPQTAEPFIVEPFIVQ